MKIESARQEKGGASMHIILTAFGYALVDEACRIIRYFPEED